MEKFADLCLGFLDSPSLFAERNNLLNCHAPAADNSLLENIPPTSDAKEGPSDSLDRDPLPVVKRRRRTSKAVLESESEPDLGSDSGSEYDPEGNSDQADDALNDLVQLK